MIHECSEQEKKRRRLLIAAAAVLALWLIVLPEVADYPPVRRHIDRNRDRQVEADAMFYTEVGPVQGITIEHRDGRIVTGRLRMSSTPPK